jgi:hypothetical protein
VKPTQIQAIAAALLLGGAVGYVVLSHWYTSLPALPRSGPVTLAVVALLEAQVAVTTRQRLAGRPGTKPILPLIVARLAALAKASSLAGAAFTGLWTGTLIYTVAHHDLVAARHDTPTSVFGVATGMLLVGCALLLERVCRRRPPPGRSDR